MAQTDANPRNALWQRIWETKRLQVIVLSAALALLSGIFFFQTFATRNARTFAILRNAYLVFTLVFVGWIANAQLSVVNILAVTNAFFSDFNWDTFLMDPLIFILWFAVAAALCSGRVGPIAAGSAPSARCRSCRTGSRASWACRR